MSDMDFQSWRCKHDMAEFCPLEGCPKWHGCARDKGWQPGQPTPEAIIRGPRWAAEHQPRDNAGPGGPASEEDSK